MSISGVCALPKTTECILLLLDNHGCQLDSPWLQQVHRVQQLPRYQGLPEVTIGRQVGEHSEDSRRHSKSWWRPAVQVIPHVQPRQGLQPVQGVPWVQEVRAHHGDRQLPAFRALPVKDKITLVRPPQLDPCYTVALGHPQGGSRSIVTNHLKRILSMHEASEQLCYRIGHASSMGFAFCIYGIRNMNSQKLQADQGNLFLPSVRADRQYHAVQQYPEVRGYQGHPAGDKRKEKKRTKKMGKKS